MNKVILKPGRERSILRRHPWIFSGAIAEGAADAGETVAVCAANGETLGYGSFSPASQIRVRMLSFDVNVVPDAAFVESRVAAAIGRRTDFFAKAETNALRLINAESDALPGVVADDYAGWVVCQFTSAGAEYWKDAIAAALMKFTPSCKGVCERRDVDVRKKEGLAAEGFAVLAGEEPPELIEITEGPVKYLVDVRKGHKTGFYLDQRTARQMVGSFAKEADVLNCFSYTGGFGLFARACGAASVTQVDISHDALELAKRNEALSPCGAAKWSTSRRMSSSTCAPAATAESSST